MNKLIVALALGAATLSGQVLASGNAANGAALLNNKDSTCTSCHGTDYKTPLDPSYPKLAGQHADYLAHALKAYKRGTKAANGRDNPIMALQVQKLSDRDIADIAAYLASLPGPLVTKR